MAQCRPHVRQVPRNIAIRLQRLEPREAGKSRREKSYTNICRRLEMIKRTIPEAAIAYVQLNDDGSINYPMLSQYSCNSQNYRDLIALSKFSYDITVSISESFEFCDRNENIVQCYDFMDENTGLYNLNNREQTLNPYEPENHGQYYQMELSPLLNYNNVYHVRVIYHYYRQTIRIYIVK